MYKIVARVKNAPGKYSTIIMEMKGNSEIEIRTEFNKLAKESEINIDKLHIVQMF